MYRLARLSQICLALAAPCGVAAHPHVFVETGLTLVLNDRQEVTAVDVTWRYDELYTLLILQDMGLDEDADGVLTDAELAEIEGFDMNWIEGYQGDLYLTTADAGALALRPPEPIATDVLEARLQSRHRRVLETPVPVADLTLRAYDPEFYTAYDLTLGVTVPAPCSATVTLPDQGEAYAEAQGIMAVFPEDAKEVPLLGHIFAETVTFTCTPKG
jgi:ABC-type uncharacterized transport system substrate-binding protein